MNKITEIEQNITKEHLKTLSTHKDRMKALLFQGASDYVKERVHREIDRIETLLTAMYYQDQTMKVMCHTVPQEIKFKRWDN